MTTNAQNKRCSSTAALTAAIVLCASIGAAQAQTVMPSPYQVTTDAAGRIVSGGCVWTYLAGTTTAVATYADSALSTPNTNPIVAGSDGKFVAFLTNGVSYKFVYENIPCSAISHGSVLKTVDNVSAVPAGNVNVDVSGTAGETINAGSAVYLSDGSGGNVGGQWYNASSTNAYSSSSALTVGFATASVTSGNSGTFRISGRVTGLAGLVAGTKYYVASGAGTITATAPAISRPVGAADTATSLVIAPNPAEFVTLPIPGGRLTLTTATPVTVSDVSAASTIYYTPYLSNQIPLYDGTRWNVRTFAEITTNMIGCTASLPYDVFAYDNSGTPTLELLAWTNATTRATALVRQDGKPVKSGATTRLYVGTVYCNSSGGQTDDTVAKRFVYNAYNRVPRAMRVLESTDSWTYTTDTFREANGVTTNRLQMMVGLQEQAIDVLVLAHASNSTGNVRASVTIGEDSTTTAATGALVNGTNIAVSTSPTGLVATLRTLPAPGFHFYTWLERSAATGTTTWYGDNGGTAQQSGLTALVTW